jgi:hypothetical protein
VTDKVRKEVAKIGKRVADFQNVLDDPVTRELPTGTWCHLPFPCSHLPTCRREGPEHPLLDLPDLSRDQESEFHQQSIEELADVDPEHPGLTFVQRRALRALESGGLVVEEFVADELRDVEYPLHFIHATSLLQVLPTLEGCHPWQHMPFQWHDTILDKNGRAEQKRFVADGKSDPRPAFASTLAEAVRGPGTLMLYGPTLEQRLRELLDDAPKQKSEVRAILNQARFDLRQLVRAGVYHPDFRASFELVDVHRSLVEESHANGPDIHDDDNAQAAFQRLLNPRTRATTREKLGRQLDAYGEQCSETILALYRALSSTEPGT